jgi:hypothetical protein
MYRKQNEELKKALYSSTTSEHIRELEALTAEQERRIAELESENRGLTAV